MPQRSWQRLWWAAGLAVIAFPAHAQSSFARGTALDWPSVITGCFLGFLLLPVAYNIAFFIILRERFLLWQILRALLLVALTISLSSLPLGSALAGDSFARQVVINILFDSWVAINGLFLRSLFEPGMLSRPLYRFLGLHPLLVATTTPAMLLFPCPPLYMAYRSLVLVVVLLSLVAAIGEACWRGSRSARFQLSGWSCVGAVCAVSLYHDVVLHRPFALFLYALFSALAVEMLVTSISIGDRFMRLKRAHDEARSRAIALEIVAHTDPLTGLPNRRCLEARFSERPRAVAIVDIDDFKQINDQFGHDVGDRVIVAVAKALAAPGIFAARTGGEEFALLIDDAEPLARVEQLLLQIPDAVSRAVGTLDRPVTASAGVALFAERISWQAALKEADRNLYKAKARGRNRAVGPEAPASSDPVNAPA